MICHFSNNCYRLDIKQHKISSKCILQNNIVYNGSTLLDMIRYHLSVVRLLNHTNMINIIYCELTEKCICVINTILTFRHQLSKTGRNWDSIFKNTDRNNITKTITDLILYHADMIANIRRLQWTLCYNIRNK